ncbi:MAG: (R)-hydratase [Caulobacterales bacterium 32-69-10]|nr:MAG: (R)-hydratase [Caulobacterales bacterium 32-69-10]
MGERALGQTAAGRFLEDLTVGDAAERTIVITEAAIEAFAQVSGDHNPVHLDQAYAETTVFRGRIAHGMLSAAYISALLAGELPGPGSIYLTQSLEFLRPVRIGDALTVRVEVTAIDDKTAHVTLATSCWLGRRAAVRGQAQVQVPRRPVEAA